MGGSSSVPKGCEVAELAAAVRGKYPDPMMSALGLKNLMNMEWSAKADTPPPTEPHLGQQAMNAGLVRESTALSGMVFWMDVNPATVASIENAELEKKKDKQNARQALENARQAEEEAARTEEKARQVRHQEMEAHMRQQMEITETLANELANELQNTGGADCMLKSYPYIGESDLIPLLQRIKDLGIDRLIAADLQFAGPADPRPRFKEETLTPTIQKMLQYSPFDSHEMLRDLFDAAGCLSAGWMERWTAGRGNSGAEALQADLNCDLFHVASSLQPGIEVSLLCEDATVTTRVSLDAAVIQAVRTVLRLEESAELEVGFGGSVVEEEDTFAELGAENDARFSVMVRKASLLLHVLPPWIRQAERARWYNNEFGPGSRG